MVPLIGAAVALVAVNDGMLPVPFATNPIAIFELVQVKLPPVGVLTKIAASTVALLHTTVSAGTSTVGVGFTVMVKLDGVPAQPLTVGVTVIVAVIGAEVVLVAVNPGRLPAPLAPQAYRWIGVRPGETSTCWSTNKDWWVYHNIVTHCYVCR